VIDGERGDEMMNQFVRDERKVMGTADQQAGDWKPDVDSRKGQSSSANE